MDERADKEVNFVAFLRVYTNWSINLTSIS